MSDVTVDRSKLIAALNDRFRGMCLDVVYTRGVIGSCGDLIGLSKAVESFSDFNEDNDPYGEHDFGRVVWSGQKVFWKIDYYDQGLEYGEDPLSPKCRRVLTVMLAEEY